MNRGFEAMIPPAAPKEKEQQEDLFNYDVKFPLFGRIFSVTVKIKRQE